MSVSIKHADWLNTPELQKVLSLLGHEDARLVGGCVRNAVIGKDVTDIDIATKHIPEKTTELLKEAGIKAVPTGFDHGTVTAVLGKKTYEITTLRKDIETDGRHAVVSFTESWEEDAQRRDFTMNTLLADADGHVFDPTGRGIDDLKAGKVIFVGDPEERIKEDYLRILRFFRFHAYYGQGEPDEAALKACTKYADKIETLSKERITQEFLKILMADSVNQTLNLMNKTQVMVDPYEYEEIFKGLNLQGRLAAFVNFDKGQFQQLQKELVLSNKDIKTVEEIIKACELDLKNSHDQKLSLYKYGREVTIEVYKAQTMQTNIDHVIKIDIPVMPVTGQDLLDQGFEAGPELGKKLKELEQKWIEADFDSKAISLPVAKTSK